MKITKQKLKEIIKEELENIDEEPRFVAKTSRIVDPLPRGGEPARLESYREKVANEIATGELNNRSKLADIVASTTVRSWEDIWKEYEKWLGKKQGVGNE